MPSADHAAQIPVLVTFQILVSHHAAGAHRLEHSEHTSLKAESRSFLSHSQSLNRPFDFAYLNFQKKRVVEKPSKHEDDDDDDDDDDIDEPDFDHLM